MNGRTSRDRQLSEPYNADYHDGYHDGNSADISAAQPLFRYPDIALPTVLAISYCLGGFFVGLYLLQDFDLWFPVGVVLLAHSLVIAAFLLHECAHGSLFARQSIGGVEPHNALAVLLSWLTGSCYSDFATLRKKHLRHHFERADIVTLDYRQLLAVRPVLRRIVEAGQWLCLPAVELLFHLAAIIYPLTSGNRQQRRRVITVLLLRLLFISTLFVTLGWPVLVGYLLAYLLFLTVMGFMDAFQHQYLLLAGLDRPRTESPTLDRQRFPAGYFSQQYEQRRTFTNLISKRWPVLNFLVLNFCYHNAHHYRPAEPWWHLPGWHEQMMSSPEPAVEITFGRQLAIFFRGRVARVMVLATDDLSAGMAPGAAGVSFLTPL